MCTILELWDIYEHNARIITFLKRFFCFGHQQLSFQIVLYAFWTLFLLIQHNNNKGIIGDNLGIN